MFKIDNKEGKGYNFCNYYFRKEGRKMKKLLTLLLTVVLCFGVCACGGSNSGMDKNAEEIIESFFAQNHTPEMVAQLEETCTNYPELTTEEIKTLFSEGQWLEIKNEPWTTQVWYSRDIKNGEIECGERYWIEDDADELSDIKTDDLSGTDKIKVKNNTLYFDEDGYKVYKLHENFYVLRNVEGKNFDEWEDVNAYDYVYTQLDGKGQLVYRNKDWEDLNLYVYFTWMADNWEDVNMDDILED